jgi:uncharacterized protein
MKCPQCATEPLVMSERQGVEIDYCASCRGVWLDRGELDKILERSVREQGLSDRRYDDDDDHRGRYEHDPRHHDPRYRKKRKKNFFEEILDF